MLPRCSGQLRIVADAVLRLDFASALRLGEALGHDVWPPAEAEASYYEAIENLDMAA